VYIRKKHIKYQIDTGTEIFSLHCPFQVVLLDFGFACLGNSKRISKINLAARAMPSIDKCPKIGRDLFHFISSLWSIPSIREKMTGALQKEISSWLLYENIDYSKVLKKYQGSDLAFAITGEKNFEKISLDSISVLRTIHKTFPDVLKTL
jgi:hypothetical protein